jgi:hypothetical protein
MLREIAHVQQIDGEPRRRWFQSVDFDLIVWYDKQDRPAGFQLCYDRSKPRLEHALTWNTPASYRHMAVDDGEGRPFRHKGSPIFAPDGTFNAAKVRDALVVESAEPSLDIVGLVVGKLSDLPPGEKLSGRLEG